MRHSQPRSLSLELSRPPFLPESFGPARRRSNALPGNRAALNPVAAADLEVASLASGAAATGAGHRAKALEGAAKLSSPEPCAGLSSPSATGREELCNSTIMASTRSCSSAALPPQALAPLLAAGRTSPTRGGDKAVPVQYDVEDSESAGNGSASASASVAASPSESASNPSACVSATTCLPLLFRSTSPSCSDVTASRFLAVATALVASAGKASAAKRPPENSARSARPTAQLPSTCARPTAEQMAARAQLPRTCVSKR